MDIFRKLEIIQMVIAFGYALTAEEQPGTRAAFFLGGLCCGLDVVCHVYWASFEKPGWLWLVANLPLFYIIVRKIGEKYARRIVKIFNPPDTE